MSIHILLHCEAATIGIACLPQDCLRQTPPFVAGPMATPSSAMPPKAPPLIAYIMGWVAEAPPAPLPIEVPSSKASPSDWTSSPLSTPVVKRPPPPPPAPTLDDWAAPDRALPFGVMEATSFLTQPVRPAFVHYGVEGGRLYQIKAPPSTPPTPFTNAGAAPPVKAPPAALFFPAHQVSPGRLVEQVAEGAEVALFRAEKARRLTGRFTEEAGKQECLLCPICGRRCDAHDGSNTSAMQDASCSHRSYGEQAHMTLSHEWTTDVRAPEDASMDTS